MDEWQEPEKYWIKFSELYPCIKDDMIEIYIKHVKEIKDEDIYFTKNGMNMEWYIRHNKDFCFMDNRYNYSKFRLFEKYIKEDNQNMFSIPLFCYRSRLKIIADIIITKESFQNLFPDISIPIGYQYFCICMIHQTLINEYQRFRATFISKIIKKYKNVCSDTIFFLSLPSNKISSFPISKKNLNTLFLYCKRLRNIKNYGHDHNIYYLTPKPSHTFLYPNMKHINSSQEIYRLKYEYAINIHEITLLPKISPIHHQSVTSFLDKDFQYLLEDLPLTDYDKDMIQKMISLSQDPYQDMYFGYIPDEIIHHEKDVEFYIDFETLPFGTHPFIYWIGVYSEIDGYKSFVADTENRSDELKIMKEFYHYISSFKDFKVFYWHAEVQFWKKAMTFHNISLNCYDWIDLCMIFRTTPILFKNCFNFKLKTIAHGLKFMGYIEITCPEECQNGKQSIDIAKSFYRSQDIGLKQKLYEYNYFDCVVMFQIIQCIRKNISEKNLLI